jgi:hypothetical protein
MAIAHIGFSLRIMVDDLNRHQTWPPPLLKKENLRNISIKKILKNPEKGQMLSDLVDRQAHQKLFLD